MFIKIFKLFNDRRYQKRMGEDTEILNESDVEKTNCLSSRLKKGRCLKYGGKEKYVFY